MRDAGSVVLDNRNLKALIKAFGSSVPYARVGILGTSGKTSRMAAQTKAKSIKAKVKRAYYGPVSNVTIGAFHEFGTAHLPIRSFLRVPITDRLEKAMQGARAFDKNTIKRVIAEKSIVSWVQALATLAEAIVIGAFTTGGYGKWKPSNMERKKNWETLVETKQLRDSITSEVV